MGGGQLLGEERVAIRSIPHVGDQPRFGCLAEDLGEQLGQLVARRAARLRQQLDLEVLTAELLAVVDQAMEPTTVSLRLRTSAKHP
jgi:hypothetical protein